MIYKVTTVVETLRDDMLLEEGFQNRKGEPSNPVECVCPIDEPSGLQKKDI